jgi:beta-glucosidase
MGGFDKGLCTLRNPLDAFQRFAASGDGPDVSYELGCEIDTQDKSGFDAAAAAAQDADVVVFIGGLITCGETGPQCQEAEALDRSRVDLPGVQLDLLKHIAATAPGTPLVVVLMAGSAVSVPWAAANASAVLNLWYPGEEGGTALVDVLFARGGAVPSGRLPVTVPASVNDLPPNYLSMKMSDAPGRTYRYSSVEALYPFGFGE